MLESLNYLLVILAPITAQFHVFGTDTNSMGLQEIWQTKITTAAKDRFIRVLHIRHRTVTATSTTMCLVCEGCRRKQYIIVSLSLDFNPEGRLRTAELFYDVATDVYVFDVV